MNSAIFKKKFDKVLRQVERSPHNYTFYSKKMDGVKEYGLLVGWFLSLFNIAFKTYDTAGHVMFINRRSFCAWLIHLQNRERVENVGKKALSEARFFPSRNKNLKENKVNRLELDQALSVFSQEMKKLSLSLGGVSPNLLTIYEVMKEELERR